MSENATITLPITDRLAAVLAALRPGIVLRVEELSTNCCTSKPTLNRKVLPALTAAGLIYKPAGPNGGYAITAAGGERIDRIPLDQLQRWHTKNRWEFTLPVRP